MTRPSPIAEDRIRERAYLLWLEEGQPEGREAEHWKRARELLTLDSNAEEGKEKPDEGDSNSGPGGEPVEEAAVLAIDQKVAKKRKAAAKRRPSVSRKRPM